MNRPWSSDKEYRGYEHSYGEPLPVTHLITHKINMSTNKSIKAKKYRYPPKLKEQLQKEIDELIEGDIIDPAASQYCSPTRIVPKHADKDGNKRWRLVTDFRHLNEITLGSCHPLPFTSDITEKLGASNYISIMDLNMGFFQIKMDPESAHLTASMGPRWSFQYKRMAMGFKESPITFMKTMDLAMAGLPRDEMVIYLNDITVFSETLEEHIIRLERVLRKLAAADLTIEPKKCQFLKHEARILGHIAGNGEIKMNPEKIKVVMEYPRPTTARKIKQFLGLTSYYRKFIEGYSKIAFPLLEILRGKKTFSSKKKGKGSDSPGSDNPRARKIQCNDDESSDSGEE
jgi:hypothetical protein